MKCSMTDTQAIDIHHDLQIVLDQKIQCLLLQLNSIQDNESQIQLIQHLIDEHHLCKIVQGDLLVNRQAKIIARQEKQRQLQRYGDRVRQQMGLLGRKQEELWEHKLEGKRIKNFALHRESLKLLQLQSEKDDLLIKQMRQRSQLLSDIQYLKSIIVQEKQSEEQTPTFDFKKIDTKVLASIRHQQQRYQELLQLEECLEQELKSVSIAHRQLVNDYCKNQSKSEVDTNREEIHPQSSKTVETEDGQSSL